VSYRAAVRRAWLSVSIVVWGVLRVPALASASPLQMFGIGGDSPARGGTGGADATGFEGLYLNPAGLGGTPAKRITIGTLVGDFELDGVERTVDAAIGVELGIARPIPFGGAWKDRFGLALGFYIPTSVITKARAPRPGTPFYALLENRSQTVGIQAGFGVKLSPRWSAGLSLLTLAALKGRIHVSSDPAGRFTTTSEEQLITDIAPTAGVRWKESDTLGLGLTGRASSQSAYDIAVTNELGEILPVTLPELRFAGVAQYDPLTVALDAAWRPSPAWLVTGQLAWEDWSRFPLPTENPVAGMPAQEPTGYHDVVVPRVGAAWTHAGASGWELALRGGYFFAWSPAPEMTGPQALLDNHRHVFSLGFGLAAPQAALPLHIDAWFQWHALVPRHNDRPEGTPDVDTSGSIFVGGMTVGVDL
jgi:long-chain fatty acid transport protein